MRASLCDSLLLSALSSGRGGYVAVFQAQGSAYSSGLALVVSDICLCLWSTGREFERAAPEF